MKESSARLLVEEMKAAGINFIVCMPDSGFREVYFLTSNDSDFQFISVPNEAEGVSIAAGAWLGGKKSVMLMENSGLRVASEALATLGIARGIPVLLLISYRGSLGDRFWWSVNMGTVTEPMLNALRIPYYIVAKEEDIQGSIQRALKTLEASLNHVAVIMSGGTLW